MKIVKQLSKAVTGTVLAFVAFAVGTEGVANASDRPAATVEEIVAVAVTSGGVSKTTNRVLDYIEALTRDDAFDYGCESDRNGQPLNPDGGAIHNAFVEKALKAKTARERKIFERKIEHYEGFCWLSEHGSNARRGVRDRVWLAVAAHPEFDRWERSIRTP